MRKLTALLVCLALCLMTLPPAAGQGQRNNPAPTDAASVPGEVLVQFKAGATPQEKGRALGRVNGQAAEEVAPQSRRRDGRGDLVLVRHRPDLPSQAAANAIGSDPAVEFAEPNWVYTHQAASSDPYFTNGSLWGLYGDASAPANQYGSQAAEAWAGGNTGSAGVYVGVIDEGIQSTHPDLDANVWTNPFDPANGADDDGNGYVDDVHGWDFANNDNTIYDGGTQGKLDDHGTHVAGTIGAESNGAGVVGVNWNVRMISGKFLGRNGGTTANAIKAVDYFTDLKARHGLNIVALNNSWGGGGFSQALLDAVVRAAQANILFIAAAGNGGRDGVGDNNDATPSYPSNYNTTAGAGYDAVIAVAAITSTGARSSFSNYGATSVDIGAPGSGVWSTTAFNSYASYSGTSMATPHVTGAAALYAAAHPGSSAAQIKNAILGYAVATASLSGRCVTGGRLNVSTF
jgi:subtilisin family serine protease